MEEIVSAGIIDSYYSKLKDNLTLDVAIAGGGPSGLVAAYFLARQGVKVSLFERNPAPGGGMWGGAMMFNEIVVQKEAVHLLDEFGIRYTQCAEGYYAADSVNASSALIYHATKAGAVIFNCISIEDVVFRNDKVSGIVINWTPVYREKMHIDPLAITAKAVLDATGHDCEIARTVEKKNRVRLNTETGAVMGERSLSADEAERTTIENTKEIFPGLYVSGMAANAVSGSWRMGPVFGGMLLSGEKAAWLIADRL